MCRWLCWLLLIALFEHQDDLANALAVLRIGSETKKGLESILRFRETACLIESGAQIVSRISIRWIQFESGAKLCDSAIQIASLSERDPEIVVRIGHSRLEFDGFAQSRDRSLVIVFLGQNHGQIVISGNILRIELYGLFQSFYGFVQFPFARQREDE